MRIRAKPLFGEARDKRDAAIIEAYKAGTDIDAIAAEHGVARKTVQRTASAAGLCKPCPNHPRKWGPETQARWEWRDKRIAKLVIKGATPSEVGVRFDLSPRTVMQITKRHSKGKTMKHAVLDDIESEAARYGFFKRRMPPDFRTVSWHMKCSKCPQEFAANWAPGLSPDAMVKYARQKQWDIAQGERPLCPACAHGGDRGPLAKPDGQSFRRWVPPPTKISDALLDAAHKRSVRAQLPGLVAEMVMASENAIAASQDKHAAKLAAEEEERRLIARARIQRAREMREQRLAQQENDQHPATPDAAPASHALPEQETPTAPQAEEDTMNTPTISPTPSPKITHAVFQLLDDVFDPAKRLYKNGYTDQRVAKDCGTSDAVVAYLRNETFGQLAEDPRISSLRDDLELLRMESAECFAKLQKQLGEAQSRLEQLAHFKS